MSRTTRMFGDGRVPRSEVAPTTNLEGFPAWHRPVHDSYVQTLLTNTFGQTFYADKHDLVAQSDVINTAMLDVDPLFAAKVITYARNKGYMRTQPIYALVRLWEKNPELAEAVFPKVIRTPNDLRDFVVILMSRRRAAGKSSIGGRRMKRMIGDWMISRLDEYRVIKYGSEGKAGFSLRDLLRIVHPKAGEKLPLFDYIMRNAPGHKVDLSDLPQIRAYEAFKAAKTDEERARWIAEGELPHEVVTGLIKDSKACWSALVPSMPIFALLRNLATLKRHGVLQEHREEIVEKLTDEMVIRRSMILPFRFVEAIRHVGDPKVRDALRDAVDIAFNNVPSMEGRTAIFLDRSGSMAEYMTTAALFALCLMRKADLDGRVLLYDDVLEELSVSKRDSLLTQAWQIQPRGCTCSSLPMARLVKDADKVDNIVMITDEQENAALRTKNAFRPSGRGSRVQRADRTFIDYLDLYRRKVNDKVKLFFVCVAPYAQSSIVPPTDPQTYFAYGWSDDTLRFVSMASRGWGSMVEAIQSGKAEENDPPTEDAAG